MPKRAATYQLLETPVKKYLVPTSPTVHIKPNTILTDRTGKKWRLGKAIGTGGFGEIFLASDIITQNVKAEAQYVAKVESHSSGPLFVEIHCYLNIAKLQMINEWNNKNGINHLGIPNYVAFGSHTLSDTKYRFLIIPRFESDLEKYFETKDHKFNLKTVLTISLQIIDVLQYIHSKGYLHLDIKASNIGLNLKKAASPAPLSRTLGRHHSCRSVMLCKSKKLTSPRTLGSNTSLKTLNICLKRNDFTNANHLKNADRIYLLDFGLACKYVGSDGIHKKFCKDERRAHVGTVLFCSRDAHLGAQSRRSDLECLAYNIIYWLTSTLPWSENINNPNIAYKKKLKCTENLKEFIDFQFNYHPPDFIYEYFAYLLNLGFDEQPDYNHCKAIFKKALHEYGYVDDMKLDFDNKEGWNYKQIKCNDNFENVKVQRAFNKFKRTPLSSNRPIRPILRNGIINKRLKKKFNWSRILLDPKVLMKNAKSKEKKSDTNELCMAPSILNLDIKKLNPNSTMLEIFNKSMERFYTTGNISPNYRRDSAIELIQGYTQAMMKVYNKKRERESKSSKMPRKKLTKNRQKKVKELKSTANTKLDAKRETKNNKVNHRKVYSLRG